MNTENAGKSNLSNLERETIINFNEEEQAMSVYTCSETLIRELDALCARMTDVYMIKKQDEFSKTYELPKKYLTIGKPGKG
jgi:hypothetical protein